MSRVFILQRKNQDYSASAKFGSVEVIFPGERPPITNIAFQRKIVKFLVENNFDPDVDYALISGANVNMHIFGAVLADMFDQYSILVYAPRTDEYFPLHINPNSEEFNDSTCTGTV